MPTTTTTTDRNAERSRECLAHLQCSMPGCANLATEPGEYTYCSADHAHVWEVRYTDLNGYRTWTRERATDAADAVAQVIAKRPEYRGRFDLIDVEKVVG